MKKILGLLIVIVLLTIGYLYFIKASEKITSVPTDLNSVTICGKQYNITIPYLMIKILYP